MRGGMFRKACFPIAIGIAIPFLFGFGGAANAAAFTPEAEMELHTSRSVANIGQTVQLAVEMTGAADAAGVAFELRFDPHLVKLATDGSGRDRIAIGADFAEYGGRTVDRSDGTITLPLLVQEPADGSAGTRNVATITFEVKEEGAAAFVLVHAQISSRASKTIAANVEGRINVIGTQDIILPPIGEAGGFDIRNVAVLARKIVESNWDLNGDDVTDQRDIALILKQIEPVALSESD